MGARAVLAAACCALASAENHAVIVAGFSGYNMAYSIQSSMNDVWHRLVGRGVPQSNIVALMFDDVKDSGYNPFPGQLFTFPGNDSRDVRHGTVIDYTGASVTPERILAVLTGNATAAGGKVLQSGPDDDVFVYFMSHGDEKVFHVDKEPLHAADLHAAFEEMHAKKMYKQLVFHIESCFSGTVIAGLPDNLGITAVSSVNDTWSAMWNCPHWGGGTVHGVNMHNCLTGVFEFSFFNLVGHSGDATKSLTLGDEYKTLAAETYKVSPWQQQPQFAGDLTMRGELLNRFLGSADNGTAPALGKRGGLAASGAAAFSDSGLVSLYSRYMDAPAGAARSRAAQELIAEVQRRESAAALLAEVASAVPERARGVGGPPRLACHKTAYAAVLAGCPALRDVRVKFGRVVSDACAAYQGDAAKAAAAIMEKC
eukprot:TRINITY_DN51_c0_g1_i12.p1 TRINITY_DN51_c0_g1~~TRINITY_DN51_c0_g1_i12.p1  ORF type:complete len:426 (+),score=126.45 TRINITY_DN51_c0_g1_i12:85-1362(+)